MLVQANYGPRAALTHRRRAGRPRLPDTGPTATPDRATEPATGSIIVVVATDAPLLPHQLKRLARRAPLGLARTGGSATTARATSSSPSRPRAGRWAPDEAAAHLLPNDELDPFFDAAVQTTEEAIVNALVGAPAT